MPTITSYQHGQFNWVDLMTPDTDAAKSFYGSLFGWTHEDRPTDVGLPYTIFKLGEDEICGMGAMPPDMQAQGIPPGWNNYINVENLEETLGKIEAAGGTVYMPAMKVMEAGWMAGVMDPSGGRVFLWQKNEHCGATRVNDPACFSWNELATRDIDKARQFYGAVLGWEFEENLDSPTRYYVIQNQGNMNGGLMQMSDEWPDAVPAHWAVYFVVENADTACQKVQELGGSICTPAFDIPIGRIAVVADPQQAAFNLFEFGDA